MALKTVDLGQKMKPKKVQKDPPSLRDTFVDMLRTLEILTDGTSVDVSGSLGNTVWIRSSFAHIREFKLTWLTDHFAVHDLNSENPAEATLITARDVRDFISGRLVDANIRANQKNRS